MRYGGVVVQVVKPPNNELGNLSWASYPGISRFFRAMGVQVVMGTAGGRSRCIYQRGITTS